MMWMMWMMVWMVLFWGAVIGGAVWLGTMLRARDGGGVPVRALVAAGVAAVAMFVVVPVIVMAARGWEMGDMRGMHGGGRDTSGAAVVRGGTAADVRIEDYAFVPGNLEVAVGATVTWTNEDAAAHDATARGGGWETERLSRGESDTLTFSAAGEYDYYCTIHPGMKARLVVR
jgi:plastocyanin